AETDGLDEIPAVGAHRTEALKVRLKMTASGSVPLAIQIVSHRVFDNKEYTQEMIAQIDVSERLQEKAKRLVADLETRCPICKGLRNSRPWAAARTSKATTYAAFSNDCRAFSAAAMPIGTKSSWFADVGIESADAGCARTLLSLA